MYNQYYEEFGQGQLENENLQKEGRYRIVWHDYSLEDRTFATEKELIAYFDDKQSSFNQREYAILIDGKITQSGYRKPSYHYILYYVIGWATEKGYLANYKKLHQHYVIQRPSGYEEDLSKFQIFSFNNIGDAEKNFESFGDGRALFSNGKFIKGEGSDVAKYMAIAKYYLE